MSNKTPYDDEINYYEQKLEDLKRKRDKWLDDQAIWVIIETGKDGKDKRLFESHNRHEAIGWAIDNRNWKMINKTQFVSKDRETRPLIVDGLLQREALYVK